MPIVRRAYGRLRFVGYQMSPAGKCPGATLEDIMPEVVVYILEGRSLEQKRGLVKDITDAVVKNAGTTAEQVTVSLVETAKTSKAKGGVLFSEMPARK
jgi:4-oxalocrotonate tautomerase